MENKAYAFAAGLFTLLLGAGVVLTAMWFSGDTVRRVSYLLESKYPVTGLNVQAPVRLRGVEVGKVETIEFDPLSPRVVLVRIAVRSGTPVTRGTVAQLGSQGVTGLAYVMLDDDGSSPEPLAPLPEQAARIPVRASFLEEVTGSGKDLMAELTELARRMNALVDEKNRTQLVSALAGVEEATQRISALARTVEPGARNLHQLTEDARKTLTLADTVLDNLNGLALQLAQRIEVLERVARGAEQFGDAAQSVAAGVAADTLPRVNALFEEIARNSRNLDRLLSDLASEPSSVVFGRPALPPGPGEPGFDPQPRGGRQ
jgi:phospholipid/cholesterol/gamma-HCH transport system substrate-binding protein